ncbi:hypothetical protein Y032_0668g1354 [Ancylostoma ceylanicum]|nr:hypothetical protein Y032_0668g1354 [Ancylostoma ceylanicum]
MEYQRSDLEFHYCYFPSAAERNILNSTTAKLTTAQRPTTSSSIVADCCCSDDMNHSDLCGWVRPHYVVGGQGKGLVRDSCGVGLYSMTG